MGSQQPSSLYVTHFFTYLENQLSCSWREYPSTLVPCLPSTVHLLLCHFSHPNTPHRSSYNIHIDDINNISRPVLYNKCPDRISGKCLDPGIKGAGQGKIVYVGDELPEPSLACRKSPKEQQ
jgi:hypothetical protein